MRKLRELGCSIQSVHETLSFALMNFFSFLEEMSVNGE